MAGDAAWPRRWVGAELWLAAVAGGPRARGSAHGGRTPARGALGRWGLPQEPGRGTHAAPRRAVRARGAAEAVPSVSLARSSAWHLAEEAPGGCEWEDRSCAEFGPPPRSGKALQTSEPSPCSPVDFIPAVRVPSPGTAFEPLFVVAEPVRTVASRPPHFPV